MSPDRFCDWLKGFIDGATDQGYLSCDQLKIIKNNLDEVFAHKDLTGSQPMKTSKVKLPEGLIG